MLGELALALAGCVEDDSDGPTATAGTDAITDDTADAPAQVRAPEATARDGAVIAQVHYQTRWDQHLEPEGPWTTTNDLGYTITVERGYLVNYSAALVECLDARGHGESINLSETRVPFMEALAPAGAGAFDSRAFPAARYCHVHYLVARGDAETEGMPAEHEPALEGLSVWLEGHYLAPGDQGPGDAVDFSISTGAPFGALYELTPNLALDDELELELDTPLRATVVLERQRDTLLDGVDFANDSDDAHARRVIENVVSHAQLSISLEPLEPDAPLPSAS